MPQFGIGTSRYGVEIKGFVTQFGRGGPKELPVIVETARIALQPFRYGPDAAIFGLQTAAGSVKRVPGSALVECLIEARQDAAGWRIALRNATICS